MCAHLKHCLWTQFGTQAFRAAFLQFAFSSILRLVKAEATLFAIITDASDAYPTPFPLFACTRTKLQLTNSCAMKATFDYNTCYITDVCFDDRHTIGHVTVPSTSNFIVKSLWLILGYWRAEWWECYLIPVHCDPILYIHTSLHFYSDTFFWKTGLFFALFSSLWQKYYSH